MNQLERTAEILEDSYRSVNHEWQNTREVWLDRQCDEFEASFWRDFDLLNSECISKFRQFIESVEQAREYLEDER